MSCTSRVLPLNATGYRNSDCAFRLTRVPSSSTIVYSPPRGVLTRLYTGASVPACDE